MFLALYLNEWTASKKLKKQKEIATETILREINTNKEKLEESVLNYTDMLDIYVFLKSCLTREGTIVTFVENMTQFKTKHPGFIYTLDSIKMDDINYKYTKMDLSLKFTLEQVELRTIAWRI
ncbi:hypothetical protein [Carboxylicivirga sp. N1Y90]|uniref:hypothetical protein n=1 Tax=Carboxylicivirga fragile TaxID=3417571 RepID=UPI003D346984|nr:hypothetical protein [Marinilabiliaceae bacterium N1Y90]